MEEVLQRFFKSIGYEDINNCFENVTVDKVVLNSTSETFEVKLKSKKVLPVLDIVRLLEASSKGINNESKVKIKFYYDEITKEDIESYFKYYLEQLIKNRPSLISLNESDVTIDEDIITVEVTSKIESLEVKREGKKIIKKLISLGFMDMDINPLINEEKANKLQEEMTAPKEIELPKEEVSDIVVGKHMDGEVIKLDSIMQDQKNVIVETFIFGLDSRELENINIITLKISDKTNSLLAKIFKRDKDEYKSVLKQLKVGSWYRIHGNVEFDNFAKDLVLSIRNMEKIKVDEGVVDDAEVKRVELHAHTFMSAMDGLIEPKKLVKFARKLGHKAVAVTDKNCLQAYPDLYNSTYYDNLKIEKEEDKFKVLYGTELSVVNDDVDVIFNLKEYNLLNDEFVVFDTETTGFHPGKDQMIEIGAVKIKNGEITDRFDELISCDRKLPAKITELTNITDEMLVGKDSEEEVLKKFLEFTGDAPLVAHNAKFDKAFVEKAVSKYNLEPFTNTIVDTMNLARILNPEWSNHKLQTLVRKYKINWDESAHHRADYDSEGTAKAFYKMAQVLYDRNIETTTDICNDNSQEDLVKFSFPFHMSVLAQNKTGLKNLFKIISLANTKYLYRGDQPKIPRKEISQNREGLLIGSGCTSGEIFDKGMGLDDEEFASMMQFYDYIEIQPPQAFSHKLQTDSPFHSELEIQNYLKRIIKVATSAGKLVCATGDVHHLLKEEKRYREIIVNQKTNGRLHPLNRPGIDVPDTSFLTTNEMLEQFSFLDKDLAYEIVVENPNKIADSIEHLEIIKKELYTPVMENSDSETEEMVWENVKKIYGENLPDIVKERIEAELKGIISNGYSVLYLIAQKLVKKSNDDGYFVGSRGSVGSSFVATMMGITEVNGLQAHYLCPKCKSSKFEDEEGSYSLRYSSGYDLPDLKCSCGTMYKKEGQDMPFATFLGFEAEKVPDIDLNFSGEYQAKAHDYTKVLFGEDRVFRAGTISSVAEKTAYGYVKGYCEDKNIIMRSIEIERLAMGITGVKRTTGQHPGGIIVIPEINKYEPSEELDIFDFSPYQYPAEDPNSSWYTTHFDFHAIHDNVLKLDILGHDDPSMLKRLEDTTKLSVLDINFVDKKVLDIFLSPKPLGITKEDIMCATGTLGIPEFGTSFVIKMLEDTKPKTFSDLVKISGLSHGTDVWLNNGIELIKNNIVPFSQIIGCRDDILTGLINYGMEPKKAFKISEFVRKGKPSKEPDTWVGFVEDMKSANVPDWYIGSCGKIKYMFPKAHATAYVMMALRVAWFKVYKPLHYYSAFFGIRCDDFDVDSMIKGKDAVKAKILEIQSKGYDATNKENNVAGVLNIALEMLARGYTFKNIDITKSKAKEFLIDEEEKCLYLPFMALDGLGANVANKIVEEREAKEFYSIEDFKLRGKVSTTLIDKMRSLQIFEGMPETSQLSLF